MRVLRGAIMLGYGWEGPCGFFHSFLITTDTKMKLHLPKMLAAAVLAAITSVGNLTCAADPVDATFTTTNSVTTSVSNFWANGFTCVLTGARLATTSEPAGLSIARCETVTLQSITSNIRASAAGGTGLALISSTGEVLSLATNTASAAGDFTWTFTDATVATGSAIYFAYYDAANTNVAVGYTLQTGGAGDLFKAGAGTLRNYGDTSNYATCAFLGSNNSQDFVVQNSQYAPYLIITTTGSATPIEEYNWNGTGTTAAWDTTSTNWLVGGAASTYASSIDGIVNFGDGSVAKNVTVNEAIVANKVNVSDNYTYTIGGTATLAISSLNVESGYTLTVDGTGTLSVDKLTGTGTIHLNAGSRFATATLTTDNAEAVLPVEGEGTLAIETVTVKGANGSVTFGLPTDNGSVQMTGGVVNYGGGVKHELDQLGLSYNGAQNSTVNVETDTTLHVVGTNVAYDNDHRMAASMFLGHWNAQNTINVYGTLISEVALSGWDGKVAINVADGGRLELRDGLNRNKSRTQAIDINVSSGGVVAAGTTHNTEHTQSHDSLSVNLSDGATFQAYYATGETTADLGGKLNFTDGTATLDVGGSTLTTTISGTLAGTGAIKKTGEGTLVLAGGNKALGGTISLTEGTLTFNSDVVLDISNLSFDTVDEQQVYQLVDIADGATYTGWDALTKDSLAGVMASSAIFKDDGTVTLTTEKPHAVEWDPNWGLTGPEALSGAITESTALITSPYKDGNDVVVELTGAGNADAYIYGVQNSEVNNTGTTYVTNVWIDAKEGSYKAIIGGSYCNNWGNGGALNMEGDTHIQVDGATVGTIIGGNYKDGQSPHFSGSSYISVMSGDVTASIVGASTNSHNATTTFTGDTHVFIYVPLATDSVNPLPEDGNYTAVPRNHVIGGISHMHNTVGTGTLEGNTNVTIDLSKYEGDRTTFVKSVTGGSHSNLRAHTQSVSGNTNVNITGGNIEFTADIVGGNVNIDGSTSIGGEALLGITGGTYSGDIIGGNKITGSSTSTVGAVVVNLGGEAHINGSVYAAGYIATAGTAQDNTVASTTVNVGADVEFGSGVLSGGFGGDGAARGTVSGMRILNLNEAEEYTNLSAATLAAFDEISVAGGGSAAVSGISGTSALDKTGSGALTLSGATTLDTLTVSAGRLTFDATGTEIGTVNVVSGATLSSTDTASTKAAITLDAGSTLSVGTAGLALESGSEFTLSGGKINFSYTGTMGQEIIVASGLTVDTIHGISFNQSGPLGDYAIAADYLTMGAQLADYTQLRVKDGNLILGKAAGGGSYWGAGIGGGTWDMASINWADDDNLTATRTFTDSNAAHFTAAGLGGAINVGEAINVTTINVSGAAYNFTGGQNLNITNGISVTDSGAATFDQVAGELKNVYIAGTASKLTINSGDVTVNAFSNEGTFTVGGNLAVKSAVTAGGSVKAGGNVTLASGTENVFGSLNATGKVSGASKLTVGGASAIGSLEGIDTLVLNNGTLSMGTASGLASTQLGGALTLTGEAVNLGSVTMANGSSISSSKTVVASGVTVSGTGTVMGGATLQTASVGGAGTLAVEDGTVGIASGSTTTVSCVLDVKSGAHIANSGTLAVTNAGRVIAGNGVNLGTVDAKGAIELNGASVSAAGGSIATLDMGAGETLTVDNNLALTTTTGDAGTLNVGGQLVLGGAATLTNLAAGALELGSAGILTATGTLETASITLSRISKGDFYLTAGALDDGGSDSVNFLVDRQAIIGLGAAGEIISLADLDGDYNGVLNINGATSFTNGRLAYTILQEKASHDIVIKVEQVDSRYVWEGSQDSNWSNPENWSGGEVPLADSDVQVKGGIHRIELDADPTVAFLTVSAEHATLAGDHTLTIGGFEDSSLEVTKNGALSVGDGVTSTSVVSPLISLSGDLEVQDHASVQADQTEIKDGSLTVRDRGTYTTDSITMTGEAVLDAQDGSRVTTHVLRGGPDSTVRGNVTIDGRGSRYTGKYGNARITVAEDAAATLYAGSGLTVDGQGTAMLEYTAPYTVMDGVQADGLEIILNDPNSGTGASTLAFLQPSRLTHGRIVLGLSARDSALTLDSREVPNVIEADSFYTDDTTEVVINQDRAGDTGIAMAVNNGGYTRNLVLAHLGAEDTNTQFVTLNGNLYQKYYRNARITRGVLMVDLRDDFYRTVSGAHSENGLAGAGMLDAAFVELNPQASESMQGGHLAAVMTALEGDAYSADEADRVLSAMSGASIAAMGAAFGSDVDRQLRAIRNRTTSMGVAECEISEDLPYVNAWINAEFDHRSLDDNGTYAGYKLSSWGGTVGFDVDCTPRFTFGLAITAMQGDFSATSADSAQGDLDRQYVSAFARYTRHAWTNTFVGTLGRADAKLDRTVNYGTGSYSTDDSTHGTAFGVMYELGYAMALDEEAATCIQPLLNLSYRHSVLDGFREKSDSDAALTADDVEANVFTAALGARIQSAAGASVYNRTSLFEGRVLFKVDSGDREVSAANTFSGVRRGMNAKATEMGTFGLEVGGGVTIPLGESAGSLFFDVTGEFRSHYSEVNGTAGYRFNF